MYFDDLDGDDVWLCNEFTGELLSIEEFNRKHPLKKICKNRFVTKQYPNSWWRDRVYVHHNFEYPRYNDFVADKEQARLQGATKLRK
jgi:hypothetical protein